MTFDETGLVQHSNGWFDVTDNNHIPPFNTPIMVYTVSGNVYTVTFNNQGLAILNYNDKISIQIDERITHWKPVGETPKKVMVIQNPDEISSEWLCGVIRTYSNMSRNGQTFDIKEVSDGSHTFNELYDNQAALLEHICRSNPAISWRSMKAVDGDPPLANNEFLIGIELPGGQVLYKCDKKYWDWFNGITTLNFNPAGDEEAMKENISRLLSDKNFAAD